MLVQVRPGETAHRIIDAIVRDLAYRKLAHADVPRWVGAVNPGINKRALLTGPSSRKAAQLLTEADTQARYAEHLVTGSHPFRFFLEQSQAVISLAQRVFSKSPEAFVPRYLAVAAAEIALRNSAWMLSRLTFENKLHSRTGAASAARQQALRLAAQAARNGATTPPLAQYYFTLGDGATQEGKHAVAEHFYTSASTHCLIAARLAAK